GWEASGICPKESTSSEQQEQFREQTLNLPVGGCIQPVTESVSTTCSTNNVGGNSSRDTTNTIGEESMGSGEASVLQELREVIREATKSGCGDPSPTKQCHQRSSSQVLQSPQNLLPSPPTRTPPNPLQHGIDSQATISSTSRRSEGKCCHG
ncbi:unnamed protein product, partial [Choristocarpus tenellus]